MQHKKADWLAPPSGMGYICYCVCYLRFSLTLFYAHLETFLYSRTGIESTPQCIPSTSHWGGPVE